MEELSPDTLNATLDRIAQLGVGTFALLVLLILIVYFIYDRRFRGKNEAVENEMNKQTLALLAQALNNKDSETAKAIVSTAEVLKTVLETQRQSNLTMERAAVAFDQNTLYRKEQHEATLQQLKAMRIDFKEWPAATKSALEVLISTVADLNRSVGLLVSNADNNVQDRREIRDLLITIKQMAETILDIAKNNAALIRSIAAPSALDTAPDDNSALMRDAFRKRETDQIKQVDLTKDET